jgi:hypothetical protein
MKERIKEKVLFLIRRRWKRREEKRERKVLECQVWY